ncbi:MAG: VWA domain-containing protein [Nitrososphaeraceae archaeon]
MIMRNDVLLDVATFLARRWSGNSKIVISLTRDITPTAKPEKSQIILPVIDYFAGTDFQKYRQWRVSLWYESMRMTYSSKVLSYEHAFGFLLNTIEKKRVEFLGLQQWQGMVKEIIFNDSISWLSRPLLNSLYGRHKIVEAFSQYFLTGYIKGELFGSEFNRVKTSSDFANSIVEQAIKDNQGTNWIEQHIPKLIKMLEIDPLISIPIIAPRTRIGMSINRSDLLKQIESVLNTKYKPDEIDKATKKVVEGNDVLSEFNTLLNESTKTENKGYESLENLGLSIPKRLDLDETQIYDMDLIEKVKAAFRGWKTGWVERHDKTGEEFDPESYAEMLPKPFLTDVKLSIRTKVAILLDHSSSIEDVELQYKQATIALCEALHHLGIKFAVYAFSTEARQVKCWIIKPLNIKWSAISARRLAQIKASGGTPLAEIYGLLLPITKSFKPEIMVTLTDGEPSDSSAVREMVLSYRKIGINMVGLGVGRTINDSVAIAHNLRYLNYQKTLAVSRLQDIPKKVINLLRI